MRKGFLSFTTHGFKGNKKIAIKQISGKDIDGKDKLEILAEDNAQKQMLDEPQETTKDIPNTTPEKEVPYIDRLNTEYIFVSQDGVKYPKVMGLRQLIIENLLTIAFIGNMKEIMEFANLLRKN